jgi:hypothetical protein
MSASSFARFGETEFRDPVMREPVRAAADTIPGRFCRGTVVVSSTRYGADRAVRASPRARRARADRRRLRRIPPDARARRVRRRPHADRGHLSGIGRCLLGAGRRRARGRQRRHRPALARRGRDQARVPRSRVSQSGLGARARRGSPLVGGRARPSAREALVRRQVHALARDVRAAGILAHGDDVDQSREYGFEKVLPALATTRR